MNLYEKEYKEALERAKNIYGASVSKDILSTLTTIFPELKKSEDEKIRKSAIEFVKQSNSFNYNLGISKEQVLAWLEKQCEKSADKVKPKFKVKYAGSEYNVLEVKDIAGVTFYGIEDEPNHIDYVQAENCEIISGYAIKENGSYYPTKPAMFSEQTPAWSEE